MSKMSKKVEKKEALTANEKFELHEWLHGLKVNPRNLRRSFTDVLPLARLLSLYYPDLVDVNIYPPRNSVDLKLSNWQLFQQRVLTRLGVEVTREDMENVARCVPGSIEILLYNIMRIALEDEQSRQISWPSNNNAETAENAAVNMGQRTLAMTAQVAVTIASARTPELAATSCQNSENMDSSTAAGTASVSVSDAMPTTITRSASNIGSAGRGLMRRRATSMQGRKRPDSEDGVIRNARSKSGPRSTSPRKLPTWRM